jgi:hypothetical protein
MFNDVKILPSFLPFRHSKSPAAVPSSNQIHEADTTQKSESMHVNVKITNHLFSLGNRTYQS